MEKVGMVKVRSRGESKSLLLATAVGGTGVTRDVLWSEHLNWGGSICRK